jgi:hypothetical protein
VAVTGSWVPAAHTARYENNFYFAARQEMQIYIHVKAPPVAPSNAITRYGRIHNPQPHIKAHTCTLRLMVRYGCNR